MDGRVNMPGALAIGDLATTTSVRLGRGGALVVDNSGTGAAGRVSVAGPLAASPDIGTGPMTCGALSAGSVTLGSGGLLRADVGSAPAPALCFGTSSATGLYRAAAAVGFAAGGTSVLQVGAGGAVRVLAPLSTNGNTLACGAMTCGALSSGAITASGGVSCGTSAMTCGALSCSAVTAAGAFSCGGNAMTCGAVSCASAASAGDATQPQYALRVYKTANQSVATATATAVVWDAVETAGGGAVNWTFTPGASLITCPQAGRYLVTYQLVTATSGTGVRDVWLEVNPPGGVPGSVRRHAEAALLASSSFPWVGGGSFTYQFSAGDTLLAVSYQASGGALNVGVTGNEVSELSVTRLSE